MVRKCSLLRIPRGSRRLFRSCDNEVYQLHNRFLNHCFSCTDLWPVSPASVRAPSLHGYHCMHPTCIDLLKAVRDSFNVGYDVRKVLILPSCRGLLRKPINIAQTRPAYRRDLSPSEEGNLRFKGKQSFKSVNTRHMVSERTPQETESVQTPNVDISIVHVNDWHPIMNDVSHLQGHVSPS